MTSLLKNNIKIQALSSLSTAEYHAIISLRQAVFVVEQACPYQDADRFDLSAIHFSAFLKGQLVSYLRVLPPKTQYKDAAAIGRVVTLKKYRGSGFASELLNEAIIYCHEKYHAVAIKISAQAHLQPYYERFGFSTLGDEYLEDGIAHIAMVLV